MDQHEFGQRLAQRLANFHIEPVMAVAIGTHRRRIDLESAEPFRLGLQGRFHVGCRILDRQMLRAGVGRHAILVRAHYAVDRQAHGLAYQVPQADVDGGSPGRLAVMPPHGRILRREL